jgi:hypothetical protein
MLEADGALELELHPTKKTAHKATSVMIVIVLKKTKQDFLYSKNDFIKFPPWMIYFRASR